MSLGEELRLTENLLFGDSTYVFSFSLLFTISEGEGVETVSDLWDDEELSLVFIFFKILKYIQIAIF